jgi:4-hydroxybenzoate polyprenyltransferase
LYAMVDREDDLKIGIKSTAILCGSADRLIIGLLQVNFLLVLVLIGFLFHLHLFYYLCLTIAVGLFCYQQYLIKDRVSSYCFQAFINNHVVGLVIFIGIVLGFI